MTKLLNTSYLICSRENINETKGMIEVIKKGKQFIRSAWDNR